MAVNGSVIVAPVNIDDVRRVLGVSSRDVGTLCSSSRINMWSKYKPVNFNKLAPLTEEELILVNYGLSMEYKGTDCVYKYTLPGEEDFPYRLSDFRGYKHDATTGLAFDKTSYSVDLLHSNSSLNIQLVQDSNYIRLQDLYGLFGGCKIRLRIRPYGTETLYNYFSEYREVTKDVSTQWEVPLNELVNLNVGNFAVGIETLDTTINRTVYILPEGEVFLYISADTGAEFTEELGDDTYVDNGVETKKLVYYSSMAYSYYIDANEERNINFHLGALKNNTGITLNAGNTYIRLQYEDKNGTEIKYIPLCYNGSSTWSCNNGSVMGGNYFNMMGYYIPSFGGHKICKLSFCVRLDNNGIQRFYNFTNTVNIRIYKD